MASKLGDDFLIDGNNPDNYNDKVLDEKETRKRLFNYAESLGCKKEIFAILTKWEMRMKNCTNDQERKHMSELGCVEVFQMLKSAKHMGGESTGAKLVVNGKVCYEDKKPGEDNLIISPNKDYTK
jgi:hypothetical protein